MSRPIRSIMTARQTISTLRKRGWVIQGPVSDYLDDDLPPPDLDDVKVMGYRVKSPKMVKSYHTAKPMTIKAMGELEKWVLAGGTFSWGEGDPYPGPVPRWGRPHI